MIYIITLLLIIINPYITITGLYLLFSKAKRLKDKEFLVFIICCCIFVSMVNATKVPENDLEWYVASFQRANGMKLVDYFYVSGPGIPCTDLGYVGYCWGLSNILDGNVFVFKFIHSFICYALLSLSVFNVQKVFKLPASTTLTAIVIMCFFPFIFTMSMQLLRQFFAGCVLIYLMSKLFYYDSWKKYLRGNLIIITVMATFHKSSMVFIPLLLLPFLDTPYKKEKKKYALLLIAIISYQLIAQVLAPYFNNEQAVGQMLQKASSDTTFELEGMALFKKLVVILLISVSYYVGHVYNNKIRQNRLTQFCNVIIVLGLFILLNLRQAELSLRMFFYMAPLLAFLYLLADYKYKLPLSIQTMAVISCMAYWALYLNIGTWTYKLPSSVLISPLFLY